MTELSPAQPTLTPASSPVSPSALASSKRRVRDAIEHRTPDRVPMDFGGSFITGMHCSVVEGLRHHYGLSGRPVKICDPYQMLGWIEDDLADALGIDTIQLLPYRTIFGFPNQGWKPWMTPWGQEVLVSSHFEVEERAEGIAIFPQGDRSASASGLMPRTGFFFDTIVRQPALDEDNLDVEDNLEEFAAMSEDEEAYWRRSAGALRGSDRAVVAHLNGTGLGDIALVPAPFLKSPRGVRDITQWYMTIASDPDFVMELFDRQVAIALGNLERLNAAVGDAIDVVVVCGTDFGTQESTFCSVETFERLWAPHYRRLNDWIHANTSWKTFKHSCGAVEPLVESVIACGFDILNPVQCSAHGMAPEGLKARYGPRLAFWGGGVNTQKTLPFGSPREVREEVLSRCRIFSVSGGFIFNAIHNVQALSPIKNVVAMIDAVHEFNAAGG